jgi:sulfate adenylyltransferase subunit 2
MRDQRTLDPHLRVLESESIHILREVAATFSKPVLMYSVGKDSSVLLRLCQKAFYPGPIPFPLLHVDTGFKFAEMYEFRDKIVSDLKLKLIVHRNETAIGKKTNPYDLGTQRCCALLKTEALLQVLKAGEFDAAIGGARRDEERSRAKERIYSFRDERGQWDPKNQRPELWNLYNGQIKPGENIRVFPLSNWTEADVWHYIYREKIPIVPLYYAKPRKMVVRGNQIIPLEFGNLLLKSETSEDVFSRFRTLGCSPCTGAIRSTADTIEKVLEEVLQISVSERSTRVIDHDTDGSMEIKKREGYF